MKTTSTVASFVTTLVILGSLAGAQAATVWTSGTLAVAQPNNQPETVFDDSLPGDAWTRGNAGKLCVTECPADTLSGERDGYFFAFSGLDGNSEFPYGSAVNYAALNFAPDFESALEDSIGRVIVGTPGVVWHRQSDTYFDIQFTSWQKGGGGGFSYFRTTAVPEPSTVLVLAFGTLGSVLRRRRNK